MRPPPEPSEDAQKIAEARLEARRPRPAGLSPQRPAQTGPSSSRLCRRQPERNSRSCANRDRTRHQPLCARIRIVKPFVSNFTPYTPARAIFTGSRNLRQSDKMLAHAD